jgi:hypothetical protein
MSFRQEKVQENHTDGYWIEAFPFKVGDRIPFLIGYGLGTSKAHSNIEMFLNPYNPDYQYVPTLFSLELANSNPAAAPNRRSRACGRKGPLLLLSPLLHQG